MPACQHKSRLLHTTQSVTDETMQNASHPNEKVQLCYANILEKPSKHFVVIYFGCLPLPCLWQGLPITTFLDADGANASFACFLSEMQQKRRKWYICLEHSQTIHGLSFNCCKFNGSLFICCEDISLEAKKYQHIDHAREKLRIVKATINI